MQELFFFFVCDSWNRHTSLFGTENIFLVTVDNGNVQCLLFSNLSILLCSFWSFKLSTLLLLKILLHLQYGEWQTIYVTVRHIFLSLNNDATQARIIPGYGVRTSDIKCRTPWLSCKTQWFILSQHCRIKTGFTIHGIYIITR